MLNTFRARSNCEQEAKFIQDRIIFTERTIAELCHAFAQYSRKAARLRDKGDSLAKIFTDYAENENINRSLSLSLEKFSDSISVISSYGDLRVQTMDNRVIREFGRYEDICKEVKEDVKEIYNAREKEIARKRQLDRIKERNPRNRQQIIQAETELAKATSEVSKTVRHLEERTNDFEKQKLHDMKAILLDFVTIEMAYHAKALESLTNAYNCINAINEQADLEDFQKIRGRLEAEFKRTLRMPSERHQKTKTSLFRGSTSFGSFGNLFNPGHRKSSGIPSGAPKEGPKGQDTTETSKPSTYSDSEESITDSASSGNLTYTEDKTPPSPVVVRKYQK